jgi:hypothetical protein
MNNFLDKFGIAIAVEVAPLIERTVLCGLFPYHQAGVVYLDMSTMAKCDTEPQDEYEK